MAILLECINLIVPIHIIDAKYPGGWQKVKEEIGFESDVTHVGSYWHDSRLFRDGAMDPMFMSFIVDCWEKRGFQGLVEINGKKQWQDFCVVAGAQLAYPCSWLRISKRGTAFYCKSK